MSGQDYEVAIRFGQSTIPGKMVRGSVRGALIETEVAISEDTLSVSFRERELGSRGLEAVGKRVAVPGAKGHQWGVKWHYFISRCGLAPLKQLFMTGFDTELSTIPEERIQHLGSYWAVRGDLTGEGEEPPTPLEYSAEGFADLFTTEAEGAGTLYPKCSVGYSIGMISHAGRALRMTPQSVVVHTNGVLPPLGALVCLQFKDEVTDMSGVSIIRGTVRHRTSKEEQRGGMSVFEIRIRDAYDMDVHGLLQSFLAELRDKATATRES